MKVEFRCEECKGTWLVDEGSLSGEMVCPNCLSRIQPRSPQTENSAQSAAATRGVAATGTAVAAPPTTTAIAATAPLSAPDTPQPSGNVVCPRCKLHFSTLGRRRPEGPPPRRQRVLVVEDLGYFRELAADALKSDGYDCTTASNLAEARAALAEGGIDLILLDLTLDGSDEGRHLLEELQPKPCPILIFTAQDESELYGGSWEELTRLGADDLVVKGMNVGESLIRKVGNLLGRPLDEEQPIG